MTREAPRTRTREPQSLRWLRSEPPLHLGPAALHAPPSDSGQVLELERPEHLQDRAAPRVGALGLSRQRNGRVRHPDRPRCTRKPPRLAPRASRAATRARCRLAVLSRCFSAPSAGAVCPQLGGAPQATRAQRRRALLADLVPVHDDRADRTHHGPPPRPPRSRATAHRSTAHGRPRRSISAPRPASARATTRQSSSSQTSTSSSRSPRERPYPRHRARRSIAHIARLLATRSQGRTGRAFARPRFPLIHQESNQSVVHGLFHIRVSKSF